MIEARWCSACGAVFSGDMADSADIRQALDDHECVPTSPPPPSQIVGVDIARRTDS